MMNTLTLIGPAELPWRRDPKGWPMIKLIIDKNDNDINIEVYKCYDPSMSDKDTWHCIGHLVRKNQKIEIYDCTPNYDSVMALIRYCRNGESLYIHLAQDKRIIKGPYETWKYEWSEG